MTNTEVMEVESTGHGHRHLGIALTIICIAQLMVVLDATIVNIAIPFIAHDLDFSASSQSWIVTGYTLAFGGLLLLGGRLGDIFGRRRVFMAGLVVFSIASLLGGLAQNSELLLAARGLQGLGAAIASPTALALITTTFPAGKQRNRAFAVYAAMSGAGAAVGLLLGGWLTEYSWRWTLLINVPIGIGTAVLSPIFLGESKPKRGAFDLPGALTGTLGLVGIVYGFTHAGGQGHTWTDFWTIAPLAAGVALLASFLIIERRTKQPLMPFSILANRTRGVSFAVMMLIPAAMFAMFYFLSQFVQGPMGYSPLKAGFAFLPFCLGIVFSAQIASTLMSRVDPKFLAGIGTLLATLGIFIFSRLDVDLQTFGTESTYLTGLLPGILIMSFGMGFVFVPLTITAIYGVPAQDSGIGSGVLNAMQQIGGALGLAILSTVATSVAKGKSDVVGATAGRLIQQHAQQAGAAPGSGAFNSIKASVGKDAYLAGISYGGLTAFLVGAGMMLLGTIVAWSFMNVSHQEISTDGHPEVAAV
jgi:EmrB/QacA subfamily drug resistance transporter